MRLVGVRRLVGARRCCGLLTVRTISGRRRLLKKIVVLGLSAIVVPCNLFLLVHLHQPDGGEHLDIPRPYSLSSAIANNSKLSGEKVSQHLEISYDENQHYKAMSDVPYSTQSTMWAKASYFLYALLDKISAFFTDRHGKILRLWPEANTTDDRIIEQIDFTTRRTSAAPGAKLKTIVLFAGRLAKNQLGRDRFIQDECAVTTCKIVDSFQGQQHIDAVVVSGSVPDASTAPNSDFIRIFRTLESPFHAGSPYSVNWTATYRRSSTIVTPYEKFVHFPNYTSLPEKPTDMTDILRTKTNMVAMFVSNCQDNNGRLYYARELAKHIQVHIFGGCGEYHCSRGESKACFKMLRTKYRYYLSFENSNCKDYITEKLYWNALKNDVIPIVMGASPEEYAMSAPPKSYIHVDDFESPADLARYLIFLNSHPDLYQSYFRWKHTGEFINTKFWCRICAMLHAQEEVSHISEYNDLRTWWSGDKNPGGFKVCNDKPEKGSWASWRDQPFNYTRGEHSTVVNEYLAFEKSISLQGSL